MDARAKSRRANRKYDWRATTYMVWAPQDGVDHIIIRESLEQVLTLPQYLELTREKDDLEQSPTFPWSN